MTGITAEAVSAERRRILAASETEPPGNPALAAAAEAIIQGRMRRQHFGSEEAARLMLAADALADAQAAIEAARPLLIPEPKGYVVLGYEDGGDCATLDFAGLWKTRAEAEADRRSAEQECDEGDRFTVAAVVELPEARDIAETANPPDDESEAER